MVNAQHLLTYLETAVKLSTFSCNSLSAIAFWQLYNMLPFNLL